MFIFYFEGIDANGNRKSKLIRRKLHDTVSIWKPDERRRIRISEINKQLALRTDQQLILRQNAGNQPFVIHDQGVA